MKLVTVEIDLQPRGAILQGEEIELLGSSLKAMLASGEDPRSSGGGQRIAAKGAKVLAPIPDPGLVLSVGMNYHEHLKEMKTPVPEKPAAFTKSVASIIASGEAIRVPPSHPDMLDWEGEFSVVIGRPCHRVKAAQALDYVFGYTLVNDVSARDWVAPIFRAQGIMGPIHAWEHNLLGKMFPTFCPMGPCIVTRDELPDPANVRIQTRLNGQLMQDASTDDLVFSVVQLIEYYSQFYRFQPGDVITTGSPSGVGFGRNPKVFMKPGDVVEVEVREIGVLRNPIEAS
ncbi:MAG TPA: fumarylacetoacetate hydrolase family protein [Burkholderiales bacterium]|jgi:2-keto-4-pentenoate hydratase/2-oxohepta-3-ene-1,7-dioic acid hydratase in catechol pathway